VPKEIGIYGEVAGRKIWYHNNCLQGGWEYSLENLMGRGGGSRHDIGGPAGMRRGGEEMGLLKKNRGRRIERGGRRSLLRRISQGGFAAGG